MRIGACDMDELRRGRRSAVAKAITIMEDDQRAARRMLRAIYGKTGSASVIGMTGPAGAGKSTLMDRLSVAMKGMGANPAVLAVDPTSHISGGAILGDRVRMSESADSGVYIRSIASRGSAGAVSGSLRNAIRVLEYAGFDPILIESVGAGQTEVEISSIADITVVVFNPNTGDSIQAIKAGMTEIGDVYVINKSDLPGSGRLFDAVRDFIGDSERSPAVVKASAKKNRGIRELAGILMDMAGGGIRSDEVLDARIRAEVRDIILSSVTQRINGMLDSEEATEYLRKVRQKKMNPLEAADIVTGMVTGSGE